MKILNYGSMNLDHVYSVPHMAAPGETLLAGHMEIFCGGKGLNQSIAVARAGGEICHAGVVGHDGGILLERLRENGIDTCFVKRIEGSSAHTVIQVDPTGQNSIIVFADPSVRFTDEEMNAILARFAPGDILMLQNELYGSSMMLQKAAAKGMKVILNPSPANEHLHDFHLELVDWFILNEIEGELLTGKKEPPEILNQLHCLYPHASVVLTLGENGAFLYTEGTTLYQPAYKVNPVDTTAAGDTFTGYFIAGLAENLFPEQMMRRAAFAASIAVSRPGAADSIPLRAEVEQG